MTTERRTGYPPDCDGNPPCKKCHACFSQYVEKKLAGELDDCAPHSSGAARPVAAPTLLDAVRTALDERDENGDQTISDESAALLGALCRAAALAPSATGREAVLKKALEQAARNLYEASELLRELGSEMSSLVYNSSMFALDAIEVAALAASAPTPLEVTPAMELEKRVLILLHEIENEFGNAEPIFDPIDAAIMSIKELLPLAHRTSSAAEGTKEK